MLGLTYVKAGADGISPSDMNDGRVAHLRAALDGAGYDIAPIMSYSTKFASNFYGPFREAADSAPQFGDRKSYQLDVRNRSDALASSRRCAEEGADLLMVKPGQPSADLIRPIHEQTGLPVGAYQVSGEFTSLVLLARENFVNFDAALVESWHNLRRAGASYIITYGARLARGLRPVDALLPAVPRSRRQAGTARGWRRGGGAQVFLVRRGRRRGHRRGAAARLQSSPRPSAVAR